MTGTGRSNATSTIPSTPPIAAAAAAPPTAGAASAAATPSGSAAAATRPVSPSELTLRVAFSVVAVPAVVLLAYAGGVYLAGLLAVVAGLAAWELYRLARAHGIEPLDAIGISLAALLPLAAAAAPPGVFSVPPGWGAIVVLLVLAVAIWVRGAAGRPLAAVGITLLGAVYTGGMLSFAVAIRNHPYAVGRLAGTTLLLLPVALTWTTDIAAYAVGRMLGRRKLVPAVSPGKTVAGAVGGVVLSVIACWAYARWILRPSAELAFSPVGVVCFGVAISVAAQIGDLVESLLKREAGVKDSSRIIPGHGGVLDRIDSLLFTLPTAYVLFDVPGLLLPAPT